MCDMTHSSVCHICAWCVTSYLCISHMCVFVINECVTNMKNVGLFCRALLQKRHVILRSLLIVCVINECVMAHIWTNFLYMCDMTHSSVCHICAWCVTSYVCISHQTLLENAGSVAYLFTVTHSWYSSVGAAIHIWRGGKRRDPHRKFLKATPTEKYRGCVTVIIYWYAPQGKKGSQVMSLFWQKGAIPTENSWRRPSQKMIACV